jgi:hypothetical protein
MMNHELQMTNRTHAGKSADSLRTLPFTSFDIRNSAFGISRARRLALMNLAIRGIEAGIGKEHADTFRSVQHPDLRADYVLANP